MQLGEEVRQPPFSGPANHVRQIIQELIRRGHVVRLLIRLDGQLWRSDDLINFHRLTVRLADRGPLRWLERVIRRLQFVLKLPYFGFFESLRFALACRQELAGFDALLERFSWMGYGGVIASRWLGAPLVLEYNGDPLADLDAKGSAPKGFQRQISQLLTRWTFKQVDYVVASGEGWRKNCMERWRVPAEKVQTVENGSELVRLLRRDQLRAFQPPPEAGAATRLVYLGGFYRWHGIDILLKAYAEALRRGAQLELTLIGGGTGWQEAQQLANDLGLKERVTFTGRLSTEAYAPYLAAADIGLAPYCGWQEYSGLKLFDYKAAGLASIASGSDGHPVTLRHGVTGWIVPPCDEQALCEAILRLASDRELVRRLGQAARIEAEARHGWEHTAEQIERILIGLCTS